MSRDFTKRGSKRGGGGDGTGAGGGCGGIDGVVGKKGGNTSTLAAAIEPNEGDNKAERGGRHP